MWQSPSPLRLPPMRQSLQPCLSTHPAALSVSHLQPPSSLAPPSGMTHIQSHGDFVSGNHIEIKLCTLEFCFRGTHSGERICIIPFWGAGDFISFLGFLSNKFTELFLIISIFPCVQITLIMHLILTGQVRTGNTIAILEQISKLRLTPERGTMGHMLN